ncbi:MAG: Rieske 2Fe-2S domain-containing protein [Alphaproteobacteria bacterium]|nr:Rieske 2Fe-2S domain-containing protein [Alphaproteobacteria bacterium]
MQKVNGGKRNGKTAHHWVDSKAGTVERAAFISDEVYRLEIERIFDRAWIYLAHDSEIPNTGDYVTRMLGSAPVIVIRGSDGGIHAHLNSCRHRGTKLCRTDSGNARHFVCPYHGWSYERDGTLITTTFDRHFPKDADFSKLALIPVTQLETFKGLIFGTWNADAEPLVDYLGEFAWYLEAFFGRTPGGMEVLAPPHRWRVKANWKVGALNFVGDSQHVVTTHAGPLALDPVREARKGFATVAADSFQVATRNGHGCTVSYLPPGMEEDAYQTHPADLMPLYETMLKPEQLALLKNLRVIVGTVFPNLSLIESQVSPGEKAVTIRLWIPTSGSEMEILSWILAEREASAAYKARVLKKGFHNFGAAGVFEQDDLELWVSATEAGHGRVALQVPYNFQTALPFLDKPEPNNTWPGRIYRPSDTEVAQFEFMRHWDGLLTSGA